MNFWIWVLVIYSLLVTLAMFTFKVLWHKAVESQLQTSTGNGDSKVAELLVEIARLQGERFEQKTANFSTAINWEAMFVQCNAEKMQALREVGRLKKVMNGSVGATPKAFTSDEIKSLISLCHPDKHAGKDSAHRMTQRLLELRT